MNAFPRYLILGGALLIGQSVSAHEQPAMPAASMQMQSAQVPPSQTQSATEHAFMQANEQAMNTMMEKMDITPLGQVDEDFIAMMTPHHQGAIDMAIAELRYGTNEQLKRIAQEIIVTQQQEIAAMYQALGKPLPPSLPAPDQIAPAAGASASQ